jgi:hypothetical protein
MEDLWSYLRFPCFILGQKPSSCFKICYQKSTQDSVFIYLCHRRTAAGKQQCSALDSHHDLYSRAFLNCWQNVLHPLEIRFILSSRHSRGTRWGSVFTIFSCVFYFLGTKRWDWKTDGVPWHFLIGGMEVLHVSFRQANKAKPEQPPTISLQLSFLGDSKH